MKHKNPLWLSLGIWAALAGLHVSGCTSASQDTPALAIVNGRPITQDEFDYRWSELSEPSRERYAGRGGKKKFLDDLISREILLQEARRLGLDQSLDLRERLERAKEQFLLDELMKDVVAMNVHISDAELEAYYDAHRPALLSALNVRAAHIVLPTEPQAKEVKQQLNQGYNFGKLAQRYSIDETTKANGGEFGVYRPGIADPGIEPVLLTLKPGIVSAPVETRSGFHLVKILSRDPNEAKQLEAVQQRLRRELFAEKRRQHYEEALVKIKAHATVRVAAASGLADREVDSSSGLSAP